MKFLGMSIVLMLSPLKILYNYSVELSKYADRINGCSGILKFGVNPDQGKLVLKQKRFLPCPSLPCVSVAQISTLEGGYVSAIAKYSGTFSYPSLGISNPNREKPTCYRIAWHLEHMNDSWKRLIETKRFKSGVAGFFANNWSNQGEWWRHDGTSAFPCLVVG